MGKIELIGVQKSFGATDVIKDVNLTVEDGTFVVFVGPSGCGKSTLLRAIIGLEPPTSGQIVYRGQVQSGLNPSAALVFQNFALFPWMTVQQNVAVGLPHLALADT